MEAKQVFQEMSKVKENGWELFSLDNLSATNVIISKGNAFSMTDANKLRREANSEAIIQAVNATWLKGLDPNKMESIMLRAKELIQELEGYNMSAKIRDRNNALWLSLENCKL